MSAPRQPSGLTSLAEQRAKRKPDEVAVAAHKITLLTDILLAELRKERGVTQTDIAALLETSRPNVSRMEHEDDVRLSTLTRYVAAMGGRVRVVAEFDDGMTKDLLV